MFQGTEVVPTVTTARAPLSKARAQSTAETPPPRRSLAVLHIAGYLKHGSGHYRSLQPPISRARESLKAPPPMYTMTALDWCTGEKCRIVKRSPFEYPLQFSLRKIGIDRLTCSIKRSLNSSPVKIGVPEYWGYFFLIEYWLSSQLR